MKTLKLSTILTVMLVAVFAFGAFAVGTTSVKAQDTPRTNCDSTTVLLLYLAERYWGFESTVLDLTQFETGQFTPYFGEIMMG